MGTWSLVMGAWLRRGSLGSARCPSSSVLADNRIAMNAGWDLEMLSLELKGPFGAGS
jgi:hypothetical protein